MYVEMVVSITRLVSFSCFFYTELLFSALALITAVDGDSETLSKLYDKLRSIMKKRNDRVFDTFRKGIEADVELVDVRMQKRLSICVGCQTRMSVHRLDDAYESGNLLSVLRECGSCVVDNSDITSVYWDAVDFNRCIQLFNNMSGKMRLL